MASTTYLDLIDLVDNFPYTAEIESTYYKLYLPESEQPRGWVHAEVEKKMPWTNDFVTDHETKSITLKARQDVDSTTTVNTAFQKLTDILIEQDTFRCIGKRHSELFSIMGIGYSAVIERHATSLFGFATRGAHLTVYHRDENNELMIWVPRRSEHVGTWKNMLDTTVAGGVAASETPFENIVREADEEASLPEELVRRRAVPAGVLTYISISEGENGWERGIVMPDVVCVYDLEVDQSVVPRPHDHEVKDFHLMSVEEVKKRMLAKEFKPNSAVIMLDFFIRHGIVTYENEKDFVEIVQRMHRRLPFPV